MRNILRKINHFAHHPKVAHGLGRAFKGCHLFYFGAVGLQSSGLYAYAAIGLFFLFAANLFLHFEGGEE